MRPASTTVPVADHRSHPREELHLPTGLSFSGRSTSHRWGVLRVTTTEGAPQRLVGPSSVLPTPRPASRTTLPYEAGDADDVVGVGIHTAGTARITTHGRTLPCAPGDVLVLDMAAPFAVTELDDFRLHLLRFPRGFLGLPAARADVLWGVHPRTGEGVVPLLAPLLTTVADLVTTSPGPVAHGLAGTVADLLGTLSAELTAPPPTGTGETGHHAAHLDMAHRIRVFVNQNLGDRSLRPETIAAHHHVSVRHVHKVFVHEGTTLSRWIQRRRLEECRRELGRTGVPSVSVSAVARRWGFTSSAHFSRCFRAVYGISPSDWHRLRCGDHDPAPAR
ncbi:helix-turn-helix domain-containing protein [Streptomyces sp. NPDC002057]|uniref:helix-turn-helix domain-containing protein n=1 Tax=Streptomyces sp. NPDC002057 TaxID=3154664 RepID=UPI00332D5058